MKRCIFDGTEVRDDAIFCPCCKEYKGLEEVDEDGLVEPDRRGIREFTPAQLKYIEERKKLDDQERALLELEAYSGLG